MMAAAAVTVVEVYRRPGILFRPVGGHWQAGWIVRVWRKRHSHTHLHLDRQTAFATAQRIATRVRHVRPRLQEAA